MVERARGGAWRSPQFVPMRLEGELARQLATESGLSYPDHLVLEVPSAAPIRELLEEWKAVAGLGHSWAASSVVSR